MGSHKDLDKELFKIVDDDSLINLCKVNKYYRNLCNDDYFWELRGTAKYGNDFQFLYVLSNSSWKQTYKLFSDLVFLINELKLDLLPSQLYEAKELDLSNRRLKKLPKEIGVLINLKSLYLHSNELEILPKEIGNLKNLLKIDLSLNSRFSGLPNEMEKLEKLKHIDLRGTELGDDISYFVEYGYPENHDNYMKGIPRGFDQLNINISY